MDTHSHQFTSTSTYGTSRSTPCPFEPLDRSDEGCAARRKQWGAYSASLRDLAIKRAMYRLGLDLEERGWFV